MKSKHNKRFFYKYLTASTAKTVLVSNRLRWSSPLLFNDPFDVVRKITFDFSLKDLQKATIELAFTVCHHPHLLAEYTSERFHLMCHLLSAVPDTAKESFWVDHLNELDDEEFTSLNASKDMQMVWNRFIRQGRIFCMSETFDNDTMWAHYSDNHRGVVLELECLEVHDSPLLVAEKVDYRDENVSVGTIASWRDLLVGKQKFEYDEFFRPLEKVKKKLWEYEREWRIISSNLHSDALFEDTLVHPSTFARVILGHAISDIDERDLRNLAAYREKPMRVDKMVVDQDLRRLELS